MWFFLESNIEQKIVEAWRFLQVSENLESRLNRFFCFGRLKPPSVNDFQPKSKKKFENWIFWSGEKNFFLLKNVFSDEGTKNSQNSSEWLPKDLDNLLDNPTIPTYVIWYSKITSIISVHEVQLAQG